jgi:hypothetical protein
MRRDKKDDEAGAGNPYEHLDKAVVQQEVLPFALFIRNFSPKIFNF